MGIKAEEMKALMILIRQGLKNRLRSLKPKPTVEKKTEIVKSVQKIRKRIRLKK